MTEYRRVITVLIGALLCIFCNGGVVTEPQPAPPPPAPPPVSGDGAIYRCVVVNRETTGWCGKWVIGCRGKGPYRLNAVREQPSICRGTTPDVSFSCETETGVSRGDVCTPWTEAGAHSGSQ